MAGVARMKWVLLGVVVLAVALRLAGIMWGLPNAFNSDEPHLVNLAVSFGGGSLRPYVFKYPTLWPYTLFVLYGGYFVLWSGFGLRHGVSEFIGLFSWSPTGFYLIGRLASAVLCLIGCLMLARFERNDNGERSWPWAALLMAFAPLLIEVSHACKPDGMLFFLACAAWSAALSVQRTGSRKSYWACGALLGLMLSTQFTALPALSVLPLAHFLSRGARRPRFLIEAAALLALAFLLGSPYALLDFSNFMASVGDSAVLAADGSTSRFEMLGIVLSNIFTFAFSPFAGIAALGGLMILLASDWRKAGVYLGPIVCYTIVLMMSPYGGWRRYLLGCYPAMALLAAEGLRRIERLRRPVWTTLAALAALGPGVWASARMDRELRLPDTRHEARAWIEANIPQGVRILTDEAHAVPLLRMEKEQVEELWRRTRDAGSPRSRLYRGMADHHPGGGYRLYRIQRSASELYSSPRHVALSQADAPMLSVENGLTGLAVDYVLTSTYGAGPGTKDKRKFFDELYARAQLLKTFRPEPGVKAGPVLKIYKLAMK